jgi:hypothetical protein
MAFRYVSPQLGDGPCVTVNAAVWARGTYTECVASSLTPLHAWDSPGREVPQRAVGSGDKSRDAAAAAVRYGWRHLPLGSMSSPVTLRSTLVDQGALWCRPNPQRTAGLGMCDAMGGRVVNGLLFNRRLK